MINDEISDLMWFVLVVDHQSFSAVAEKFDVSKAVISKYITRLEQQLGVQLLKRTTRKLHLTELGEAIYQRATHIAEEMQHIKHLAYSQQDIPQGRLRVNAPFGFGQHQMVPAIAAFMQHYPQIQVELILGSYLSDLVHDGIDLAIYLKKPEDPNVVLRKIGSHQVYVCATPRYLAKHGEPKKPQDLLQHNCLVYKSLDHKQTWNFTDKKRGLVEVDVHGNFSANSSQTLLNAALHDMGIIKLSSHMVRSKVEEGKLIRLLEMYCSEDLEIYVGRAQTSYLPKKQRLFVDFLLTYFLAND